jgi:hypothetical protein
MSARWSSLVLLLSGAVVGVATTREPRIADTLSIGRGALLHAHNCYPDNGQWADRIDRALATGLRPLVIEQDLVWAPAEGGRPVVSHGVPLSGKEPTLEEHFFLRMKPLVEQALRENRRDTWPVLVLHLDFKTNEPEHHRAVWDLLTRYESWLTWAPREPTDTPQTLRAGPVLVLTEHGVGQEVAFYDRVPIGGRLLVFGTVPPVPRPSSGDRAQDLRAAASASPLALIPSGATNYRRWTNHSWAVIEQGGQAESGEWTADDDVRLNAVVGRAHGLGLWIRFYTLNGHTADSNRGWTPDYNFGALAAVQARWRAAIAAGVDFVATDQYEDFAAALSLPARR